MFFCLCYVVPENSSRQSMIENHTLDRLLNFITNLNVNNENCFNFVLCGDFNAHTSDCPDFVLDDSLSNIDVLPADYCIDTYLQRCSRDKGRVDTHGLMLLDLCKQTGLRILNGRFDKDKLGNFTHIGSRGSSVVDYVITTQNLMNNVSYFQVHDPNILSDHCVIDFSFEFKVNTQFVHYDECNLNSREIVHEKYKWNNDLKHAFISNLSSDVTVDKLHSFNCHVRNAQSDNDVDNCISEFSSIIGDAALPFKHFLSSNDTCNSNTDSTSSQPWFNEECASKRQLFYAKLNLFRQDKSEINRKNMVNARSQYKTCLRNSKFEYDKLQTSKLQDARFKNAKIYWNMLKQSAHVKQTNLNLNEFEQYFKCVNNPEDPFFTPDEDILYFVERYEKNEFDIMFAELNLPFEQCEIIKAIKQLNTNKSAGPDMLLNEFFIHGKDTLSIYLLSLFNKIFELRYFPKTWTEGFVVPLHKKGSINDVNNFRGITLLSTLGKLFTRVINNRLTDWAEKYNVYIEAQAGFRSKLGTVDNIFVLHGIINHIITSGKQLYCAFIDFTKAFDYVTRDNLWAKLIKLGIRGNILDIMKSMYSAVKSRVKLHNELSDGFSCMLGVRQGESISPFLFAMFLNDIEDVFISKGLCGIDVDCFKMFLILYADDIVIFANCKEELQLSLNVLHDYCNRWKLKVNTSKTKIMIFRKGGRISSGLKFYFDENELEIVEKFTYLGIVFTSGGSFSCAQNVLSGQALKAIFKMNKYLYKFTNITVKHKLELFDKLISPILNYSSQVWGFIKGNAVERVHLQFCKRLLGVRKNTQNDFVYGELGRLNYQTLRLFNIVKYWTKLLNTNDNKYNRKVYNMLKSDMEIYPHKSNWCSLLKDLLCRLGFYDAWYFQYIGNANIFISLVKQRLTDNFVQNWHSRINDSSRALFYRNISSFNFQPYLDILNIKKFRIEFSKLRMSSHRLHIESGRWNKPQSTPLSDRICSVCQVLEDEFHFIFECKLYSDIRIKYIPSFYRRNPSMSKLIELLNNENKTVIFKLSVYIKKAFEIRNAIHYT